MNRFFHTLIIAFITNLTFGQNLYLEKFNNCKLSRFCLDCGETKALPPQNLIQELISNFDSNSFKKIKGQLEIQVLIDSTGKPCILSATNHTNIKSNKLKLQYSVNNSSLWKPAISGNKITQTSVSLILNFENGNLSIKRKEFDFKKFSNTKSVGKPEIKGTNQNKLSETWTVYTQQNSKLPWDMTRAIVNDLDNKIWIGTDNGIAKIDNGIWEIFNAQNSSLKATPYNKNRTESVRDAVVDKNNNKWFIVGYDVYKYDNQKWTVYDSINSLLSKVFISNVILLCEVSRLRTH